MSAPDPQSPGAVLAGSPQQPIPPQTTPPPTDSGAPAPPPQLQDVALNARQGPGMAPPSGFPQQQTAPQPTPQQKAQAAEIAHHSALGKIASTLLGKEIQYKVDPTTGEVQPYQVKETPGQYFRGIVAGVLMGAVRGAAAGFNNPRGGFLGGAAQGGVAVAEDERARDEQNRARAQEQFKNMLTAQQNQRETQAAADEHLLHQASAAHLTAETVSYHHLQDLHDQEALDAKNKAARIYMQTLEEAGGHAAPIPVNGKVPANGEYNASDLSAALTKDPKILFGAPGTVRHFVDLHNASDVEYVEGTGWVNDSGKPANLTKSAVVKVYDVPESIYKTPIHKTGTEINTLVGYQLIPKEQEDHVFTMPLDSATNLYSTNLKNLNQKAQADQREGAAAAAKAKANNAGKPKAPTSLQFKQIEKDKDEAIAKAQGIFDKSMGSDKDVAILNNARAAALRAYDAQVVVLKGGAKGQPTKSAAPQAPQGKATVFAPDGTPHVVDADKLRAFLADPQYKGWHQ